MYGVHIGEKRIPLETVDPISTCFSMQQQRSSDPAACNEFNGCLRPALFFSDTRAFDAHHLDLLRRFFARQHSVDDRVTCSFDVMFLDKRTGIGRFWKTPDVSGRRVSLSGQPYPGGEGPISATLRLPGGGDAQVEASVVQRPGSAYQPGGPKR